MISVPERVKDALRDGRLKKNYNFHVLRDNGVVDFTIDNSFLVYESVKFDERMCSDDTLKFGLCEGTSLEFQYFGKQNINGRVIRAYIRAYYKDAGGNLTYYSIPMGYFTVSSCSMQASTGIFKATCYNKLQSKYLDAKANELLIEAYNNQDNYSPSNIEKILDMALADYKIDAHTEYRPILSQELSSKSRLGYCPTIDIQVYKLVGQVAETHYLHAICPFILFNFSNTSHMYKFADFNTGRIGYYVNTYSGYYSGQTYEDYNVVGSDEPFYAWLMTAGANVSEIRGGIYVYSYTDASNTAHTVSDFVLPYHSDFPTPYYWGINTLATGAGSAYQFGINTPVYWVMDDNPTYSWTGVSTSVFTEIRNRVETIIDDIWESCLTVWKQKTSLASDLAVGPEIETWPDVTLRELQSAIYELSCQYGQIDRVTDLFNGVDLNHAALYPADTLYPANDLFPGGVSETSFKSWYSKLWTDTVGEQSFRNLIITYKGLDGNNVPTDFVYETVVDPYGTTDYIMDDNWLFRNLIWTQQQIETYAAGMVTKMQSIHWFPFEMWAAGLPYIETGDMIEIIVGNKTYTSYVLQRQLSGIWNLQDTYINGTLDIF